jgi:acetylornithine deacetylase/succinyl-diaminopimelate desuccinylase-like protein
MDENEPESTRKVEAELTRKWEQILETIKAFVRIPSVSTDPFYADGIIKGAAFVAELLRRGGIEDVVIHTTPGHPIVTGAWRKATGRPTVLVYGHYDVQPPDPVEAWTSPPFEPVVRDGRVYGRGVSDDKPQPFS